VLRQRNERARWPRAYCVNRAACAAQEALHVASELPPAVAHRFDALVPLTPEGISSRLLARTAGGVLTLFTFDAGQTLAEHTSPFEAFAQVLEGAMTLTIGGQVVQASPGTIVRMPARVPHAVEATAPSRMLLTMLRDAVPAPPADAPL
jgi:quercetin dioxygenase-like cupin family protein